MTTSPIIISGLVSGTKEDFLPFKVKGSGTAKNPIVVKSHPTDLALIKYHYLDIPKQSYIRFESLCFNCSGQIGGKENAYKAHHITFKNCFFLSLDQSNQDFVQLWAGNDDWTFDGCIFQRAGNGIYTKQSDAGAANRLKVNNCRFEHMGVGDWPSNDGHAIGIQGGSGHRLTNNTAWDCGTAICLWSRSDMKMTDCIVDGNRISKCQPLKTAIGSGIEISGSYNVAKNIPQAGWRKDIKVRNNVIDDCVWGIRSNIRDPFVESGNRITNAKLGEKHIENPFGS